MGKTSTLIYLFSNFDESDIVSFDFDDLNTDEFDYILDYIEQNAKKVPDRIVDNVIQFAQNYSK